MFMSFFRVHFYSYMHNNLYIIKIITNSAISCIYMTKLMQNEYVSYVVTVHQLAIMPVVRNDPCGWTCLLMTYAAVIYADYVIIRWVVLQTMQDSAWGIGRLMGHYNISVSKHSTNDQPGQDYTQIYYRGGGVFRDTNSGTHPISNYPLL